MVSIEGNNNFTRVDSIKDKINNTYGFFLFLNT